MNVGACPASVSVNNTNSLIESVRYFLNNPKEGEKAAAEMISRWDYPEADFRSILVSAVYGST